MKKSSFFFLFIMIALPGIIIAQSPQSFQYQAVVRNSAGTPVVSQNVGVRISILQGSVSGSAVYTETHSSSTNALGIVTLAVGSGVVQSGNFTTINWAAGPYFLKLQIDPAGGTSYVDMGATQLLSVPYALYAAQSGSVSGALWESLGANIYNTNVGKVGIGTTTPPGKLVVQGDASMSDTVPLFEVKDRDGHTVFIIYPDSARLYVGDDGSKTNKGAFAVSGRNTSKQLTNNFLWITPDSTRIFTGDESAGFGIENLSSSNTGSYLKLTPSNYFIGSNSGNQLTTGMFNSTFGYKAGELLTTGSNNVFIGYEAGNHNTGGYRNVFIGMGAGENNSSGYENNFIGYNAGRDNTTGDGNVMLGMYTGLFNTTGYLNTFVGRYAGFANSTGNFNVFIGNAAGDSNTEGEYLTLLGSYTDATNTNLRYSTAIGYSSSVTADYQVRLGNFATTSIGGQVGWTTLSDKRFKKNIENDVPGLDFILKLKPVSYNLDTKGIADFLNVSPDARDEAGEKQKAAVRQVGFLAQDVEKAALELNFSFSGIDKPKNENDTYGLRYAEFTVPLVKAVQELSEQNKKLSEQIRLQQIQIEELKKEISNIKQ
jgi:hypothetical protein